MFSVLRRNAVCKTAANYIKLSRFVAPRSYVTIVGQAQRQAFFKPALEAGRSVTAVIVRPISISAARLAAAEGSNHVGLWTVERILVTSMLAILPCAFIYPSRLMDLLLALSAIMHSHWGMEVIIVDYLRPNVVGHVLPKLAHVLLVMVSVGAFIGMFELIKKDDGLAKGLMKIWDVKFKEKPAEKPDDKDKKKKK
ncbi:succinate dehydrogenase [ubiquinone] cytochrome b small subunit, mitochondrial-like isoform X2 [Drosophila busckii]|uniref:succinate dehydrogenase [ubiquinone] cytochrome b small subunit, mitochondrial-like isoform X2 n=1 Tax=Drosophila busckii TaxID=30019 RepID=UPI00083F2877|nr:succinate dehydrogenase [ubiquinone] cytochrome b small subunit, mitochondrial-like isoform X2 [Drosophila busckii]